jgi:hypothetical protein
VSGEDLVPQDLIKNVDYKIDLFHCVHKYDNEMSIKFTDDLFQAGSKTLPRVIFKKKQEDFTCMIF